MTMIWIAVGVAEVVMMAVSGFFWTAVDDPGGLSVGADVLVLLVGGIAGMLGGLAGWGTAAWGKRSEWAALVVPGVFAAVTGAAAWVVLYIVHSMDCMLAAETSNCSPPSSDKVATVIGLEFAIVVYGVTAGLVQIRNSSPAGARR